MKKIKILMPLTGIAVAGAVAPTLASCSCGNTPTSMITITFDPNNGQSTFTKEVKAGTKWSEIKGEISNPTPSSSDQAFDYWTVSDEGAIADDYKFDSATTVRAKYFFAATISFVAEDHGKISSSTSIVIHQGQKLSEIELPTATPDENYYFVGWYDGENEVDYDKQIYSNITLTAKFKNDAQILDVTSEGYLSKLNFKPHGSFTVPDTVTPESTPITIKTIGPDVFKDCAYLTEVKIGKNVTTIGTSSWNGLFSGCTSLTSVIVDDANTVYTSKNKDTQDNVNCIIEVKDDTDAKKYTIIAGCKTTIIPDYITGLADFAFNNISGLEEVTVPTSCVNIGGSVFKGCADLKTVTFKAETVTTFGTYMFSGCKSLATVTLPKKLDMIPACTFSGCEALKDFDLGLYTEVTSISNNAFDGCEALESITIPAKCTSIATGSYQPFLGCTNLTKIVVASGNTTYTSRVDGTEYNCIMSASDYSVLIGCSASKIANNVKTIGTYAFKGVKNLTSIDLNNVEVIESSAFYNSGLTSVTMSKVKTIDNYAFQSTPLASVSFPETLTSIGQSAFQSTSITSVTLPSSLTSLGSNAFSYTKLTSVSLPNNDSIVIPSGAFANIDELTSINVPAKTRYIYADAFDNCPNVTSITVDSANNYYSSRNGDGGSSSTTNVDLLWCKSSAGSVYGDEGQLIIGSNNANIQIPKGVTKIRANAFKGMKNILTVASESTESENIYYVGNYAFANCENLAQVSLGIKFSSNNFIVSDHAFDGCKKLTAINFNTTATSTSNVLNIGKYAFSNCSALATLSNHNINYWNIDEYAFAYCSALPEFNFTGAGVSINKNAFYYCTGLKSVTIEPEYSTSTIQSSIAESAFYGCSGLTYVKLMPKISETSTKSKAYIVIGEQAFNGCPNIETLIFNATAIGSKAFNQCTALKAVDCEYEIETDDPWPTDWSTDAFPESVANVGDFIVINRNTKELIQQNWKCFANWRFTV